jgi:hypothetical protein
MFSLMAGHRGDPPDDRLQAALEIAQAAFNEARDAFRQLEAEHAKYQYGVLGGRLHALGEALSDVRALAVARRREITQHPDPEDSTRGPN